MSARLLPRATRLGTVALVGGLVLSLSVFGALVGLDRNGDRQKQAQLLVSQVEGRITILQNLPWDTDPVGANQPPKQVRAQIAASAAHIRADLLELQEIAPGPAMERLLALLEQNLAILERHLVVVAAGDEEQANEVSNEAAAVFEQLKHDLGVVAAKFSRSADSAYRYGFVGTAALLLVLYLAFAMSLTLLVRTQKQSAAKSERLRQAQKMEAVGQLAGGIAHDFNNLLLAIRGFAELAESSLEPDAMARRDIREVIASADRATALTSQLLAFSREQVLRPVVIDPNEAVSDVITLLERLIGQDIAVVVDLDPDAPRIEVDEGQFGQVILNLAVNARDAMPDGGRLTITTARSDVCPSAAGHEAGPWVVISVSDTGFGIDEQTRTRIFEPFFTTKEAGSGTGLGLATVSGIVAQSRGHVSVKSRLGHGTTFQVFLPATEKRVAASEAPTPVPQPVASAETVLLVEDNDIVRTLVAQTLEDRGYAVVAARNGNEALDLASGASSEIDLLLTDLTMPGMSGLELAKRLDHLPVLYMSGHPKDFNEDASETRAFIQKPFAMAELTHAVGSLLARP